MRERVVVGDKCGSMGRCGEREELCWGDKGWRVMEVGMWSGRDWDGNEW